MQDELEPWRIDLAKAALEAAEMAPPEQARESVEFAKLVLDTTPREHVKLVSRWRADVIEYKTR